MSLFDDNLLSMANTPVAAPITTTFTGLGDDAWFAASQALATDTPVHPAGMVRPFLPWQAAAFTYALASIARWSGALVGDDMGMGKTQVLQALIHDALGKARTAGTHKAYAIVVSPTVAEHGWRTDLQASFPGLKMHTVRGRTVDHSTLPEADIYFISDDPLTLKAWLAIENKLASGKLHTVASEWARNATIVVRDEIHRDKGNMGKPTTRSRVMLAVGDAVRTAGRAIVGATGTLLTNRPVEAYVPLQIVGGEQLVVALTPGASKMSGFLWRYCAPTQKSIGHGRTAWDFKGQDNESALQLHEYLRRTVYVRREKADLGEGVLPDSGYNVVPIALDRSALVRYNRIAKDLYNLIVEEKGVEAAMRAERSLVVQGMMAMWQEAGKAKAPAAVEYMLENIPADESVVMFFHHESVRDAMMLALVNAGVSYTVIDGKVTDKRDKHGNVTDPARTQAIEEFQAGEVRVMLAQHGAAGLGVTLTAAKHAMYIQLPWSAGTLAQCSGRILRVDQTTMDRAANGERVTWHVIQGCYDNGDPLFCGNMWDVLCRKSHLVDSVNAGKPITITDDNVQMAMLESWMPDAKRYGGW